MSAAGDEISEASRTLRGSLTAFPLDLLLGLLIDAKRTGRLTIGGETTPAAIDLAAGRVTAAVYGTFGGEEALAELVELETGTFEFLEHATGGPNLFIDSDRVRARARAARVAREERPHAPGPDTLRFAALRGILPPRVAESATAANMPLPPDAARGVAAEDRPAPSPDPLWSARHLAAIVNAMLSGYLGTDAALRTKELGALSAEAQLRIPGVTGPLPVRDGGLDVAEIGHVDDGAAWLTPMLQFMVRRLFEEDDAVQEGTHAQRVYFAAIERTLQSADQHILAQALRLVGIGTPMHARIVVERGGAEGPFQLDEREHGIGRSSTNDVRLLHNSVSRRHARLTPRCGRFILTDIGSTAGTRVNGELVTRERVLRSGDAIAVGEVLLALEYVEA